MLVLVLLEGQDAASPLVFDPGFYLNTNPDLLKAGIVTPEAARSHWLNNGIQEGRQGCGSFHSRQYLARYTDLANAFHTNYVAAVQHYLQLGHAEARLGYVEHYETRWTISNGKDIFISASARMGAAIDSLVWNNKEFINAGDHGRELQMACNTDYFVECYNPTEAGGRDDGIEITTKTIIQIVKASGQTLQSQVLPAFWLRPGTQVTQDESGGCHTGSPALNSKETYDFNFQKVVTIGCAGHSNCIEFVSKFTIGGNWPSGFNYIQMEAPTGYLTGEFTKVYNYNSNSHQIEGHNSDQVPIVMTTGDDKYAMGVYAPPGQDTDAYQYYGVSFFPEIQNFPGKTSKWNVVFRKRKPQNTTTFTYKSYICVGNLAIVKDCLGKVIQAHPHV
ncbi:hypothetical protein ACJMK2_016384 [Sinanodonta woodiana]|uniref:Uncharacterized protein n=1 Tax=Sinanodonta woodiana TaxID=1069815 RepID=A0ABD3UX19_SINWO